MKISCVHRDNPEDLTLAAEECSHPPLPHLVVSTIKVEDPNLVPGMPSLDLRLVRITKI
jgi:hypothetical protein